MYGTVRVSLKPNAGAAFAHSVSCRDMSTTLPREIFYCIDCSADLTHALDWEPFFQVLGGERVHFALCSNCIDKNSLHKVEAYRENLQEIGADSEIDSMDLGRIETRYAHCFEFADTCGECGELECTCKRSKYAENYDD